ncbi:hypothetical protein [Bifidobacterium aquikefiricola]|uniref:Uncharacterized protein n=1 Tax=Bifidobacterium aquikefiricola TaxID=3059038 RepID=A0AB39U6Z1_9BIFI
MDSEGQTACGNAAVFPCNGKDREEGEGMGITNTDFLMAFEVLFSIATWEYMKHLWDERIAPARQ